MIRPPISAEQRRQVLERDRDDKGPRCRRCGTHDEPFEIDHELGLFWYTLDPIRFPLDKLSNIDNLRLLCVECHESHTTAQAKVRAKIRRATAPRKERPKRKWPRRPFPKRRSRKEPDT